MAMRTNVLRASLALVAILSAKSAFGQALLPGNVWPNSGFNTAAAPGVDQVYSYYNGSYSTGMGPYMPNTTGDTNPRPAGWHRGGVDFGTQTAPQQLFYNPSEGTTLSAPPSGNSLEVNDQDRNNYGEWFSDFNALPTSSVTSGTPINVRFYWEYAGLNSTQRPTDVFRVSVDFADSVGDDTLTAPNQIGNAVDDTLIIPGTADLTTFTQVNETITPPAGAKSIRITIDSGGSSQAEGEIFIDNISVAAVPEPASITLIGAGAMLLSSRRRRVA